MQNLGVYSIRKSGRGLVVTIPQKWADMIAAGAGDIVEIQEIDGLLVMAKIEDDAIQLVMSKDDFNAL